MPHELRRIVLRNATGEVRRAEFRGREHLVVPVVALVEGVVFPMGAEVPELVTAEVLAKIPDGWNNRPVLPDHPVLSGQPVSANTPRILETQAFGQLFNTADSGQIRASKRLTFEAWLDAALAESVGEDAVSVCERAATGEPIEVSVGATVLVEIVEGEFDGKPYGARWLECHPDHFAMLPVGAVGACSNEMGCGTLRAATHHITATGIEYEQENDMTRAEIVAAVKEALGMKDEGELDISDPPEQPTPVLVAHRIGAADKFPNGAAASNGNPPDYRALFVDKGMTYTRTLGEDEMSDTDIRHALWQALHDSEPGFDYILDVFPGEHTVIYCVLLEGDYMLKRRSYSVADDNAVTLMEDAVEVQETVVYEPLSADTTPDTGNQDTAPVNDCGCQTNNEEGHEMAELRERIKALIDNKATPYEEADAEHLEARGEDHVAALEVVFAEPGGDPPPVTEPESDESDEDTVSVSREEYEELRAALAERKAQRAARKAELLKGLKGVEGFTEDELKAEPLERLEKLAKALKASQPVPEYAGVALGAGDDGEDLAFLQAPDPYRLNKPEEVN